MLKWSIIEASGSIPPARDGHSACVIDEKIYIFGGYEERVRLCILVICSTHATQLGCLCDWDGG